MAISREVLLRQREKAMQKGYLTKGERETFEKYIGSSVETNPTHLSSTSSTSSSSREKSTSNMASRVYDAVSKTPINDYVPTGGREVIGHDINKDVTPVDYSGYDLSGGFNDAIGQISDGSVPEGIGKYMMYGLGIFIILGVLGN